VTGAAGATGVAEPSELAGATGVAGPSGVAGVAAATRAGTRWLVACDLDQTLIYSRRAFRLPAGVPEPPLLIVEYLDGEPLSYLTRAAGAGLRELARQVPVVPVTTRTLAQYRRVDLGFAPSYAIAANGGHLLVDGRPHPGWEAQVRRRLVASGSPLADIRKLADELARQALVPWVRTIRDADGFFVYLVATGRDAIPDLTELAGRLAERGWTLSVQGRKVYLVPAALTKEAAIAEVVRRTGAQRYVAAGDSLLDLGMLTGAAAAVLPAHGELHAQRITLPHGEVSDQAGLLGGEEVVKMLVDVVAEPGDRPSAVVTFHFGAG
jgi:predicted mannosyl-3-phosphoglycerate phosphatase (HAD superfamily)